LLAFLRALRVLRGKKGQMGGDVVPPINLWVLAGSTVLSNGLESTRNHRSQRPGMIGNHANSLHYFGHEQMQRILVMHGGKA